MAGSRQARGRARSSMVSLARLAFLGSLAATLPASEAGADLKASVLEVNVAVTNNCTVTTGASSGAARPSPAAMNFRAGAAQLSVTCTRGASSNVRLKRMALDGFGTRSIGENRYYFYTRSDASEVWGKTGSYELHARQDGGKGIDAFIHGPQSGAEQLTLSAELVVALLEF